MQYEVEGGEDSDFHVYMYQLSAKGRRTGNRASVRLLTDGTVLLVHIFNNEDNNIVDNDPVILEDEAIELAYDAVNIRMLEVREEQIKQASEPIDSSLIKPTDGSVIFNDLGEIIKEVEDYEYKPLEVYIDDRGYHVVNAVLTVHKGKQIWQIEINNVKNNKYKNNPSLTDHTMVLDVTLDANTGEVIRVGYSN